jgi:hypothetical protein
MAELTEDIRSEIEEREASLGHRLTEAELEELLKKRGSPYRVAGRFLPQRHLIGPAFFPIYTLILKGITIFYLVPWLGAWLFMVLFLPSYRAAHPGLELLGTLRGFWNIALYSFLFTTVGVALLERSAEGTGLIDQWDRKWNPRHLPAARDPFRISRGESVGQFLGGLVFALYWLAVFRLPHIPDLEIGFAPILAHTLYWPVLILALAGSAVAAWNLVRPRWTRPRLVVWLTICGLEIIQSAVIASAGALVVLHVAGVPPAKMELLYKWANTSVRITILAIGAFAVVDAVRALRLLMRLRSAPKAVVGTDTGRAAVGGAL